MKDRKDGTSGPRAIRVPAASASGAAADHRLAPPVCGVSNQDSVWLEESRHIPVILQSLVRAMYLARRRSGRLTHFKPSNPGWVRVIWILNNLQINELVITRVSNNTASLLAPTLRTLHCSPQWAGWAPLKATRLTPRPICLPIQAFWRHRAPTLAS